MTLIDATTPEMAVVFGAAAFVLFLLLYGFGRLLARAFKRAPREAAHSPIEAKAPQGPSYTEIAARGSLDVPSPRDEPVFTPAPDYASASMEIPANASYTQIAVATASAQQRGLKPKMAHAAAAVAARPDEAPQVMSYTAVAAQTVGEPHLKGEAQPGPSRVDYSSIDIELSGLESYAAVAVAAARNQASQAKTLH